MKLLAVKALELGLTSVEVSHIVAAQASGECFVTRILGGKLGLGWMPTGFRGG